MLCVEVSADDIFSTMDPHTCLAYNIYHEARGQPLEGQFAVGIVTLNRVKSKKYPNTVCEVVRQGKIEESKYQQDVFVYKRSKCQFSWFCDSRSDVIADQRSFRKIKKIVGALLNREYDDLTKGALYYHAKRVKPWWSVAKVRLVQIGDHIFYKG